MTAGGELTPEQELVAHEPAACRQLVTAGPGTGKTHTLIARIGHLVEVEDVHPAGILTLSFSRAAVGELRRRLRATGDDSGRVAPITFDSFATRVLMHVDDAGAWVDRGFDGRIQAAIERIDEIGELLDPIKHVCVDEVQDLVGVRMRFVRALLEKLGVGFTLLGDPAQGIYDFSLAQGETAENDARAVRMAAKPLRPRARRAQPDRQPSCAVRACAGFGRPRTQGRVVTGRGCP